MEILNWIKKIFKGDWEVVKTYRSIIEWRDLNNLEETLAYYHVEYSKSKNRYRLRVEKINSSYRMKDKDPKDHKLYHQILEEVNKANLEIINKESEKESVAQKRDNALEDLLN